jgi:hypothetical protein
MPLKLDVQVDQPAWLKAIRDKQRPVATAAVAALREAAADAVQEGRSDIAAAGRFGPKWQQGLQYRTSGATAENGEPSLQAKAVIFHKIGFAGVFEYSATIAGKPLLWLPTTPGGPPPKKSGKKLVSVNIAGKAPMLFDANDHNRNKKPLYVGVPSVRITKKWHITEIVKKHADQMGMLFLKHFKDN